MKRINLEENIPILTISISLKVAFTISIVIGLTLNHNTKTMNKPWFHPWLLTVQLFQS